MGERRIRVGQWLTVGALVALFAPACGEMSASDESPTDGGAGGEDPDMETGVGGSGGSGGSVGSGGSGGSGEGGSSASAGSAGVGGGLPPTAFTASPTTFLIHNAPDTFPIRICLEVDGVLTNDLPYPSDFDNPMPMSNYPGIPVGGAWNIDELLQGINPASDVTFHLLDATSEFVINEDYTCEALIGSLNDELRPDFKSVDIDLLTQKTVRALVLEGCKPESTLTATQCGEDFSVVEGNRTLRSIGLSPVVSSEPATHIYPMHLSPSLAALPAGTTFPLTYGTLGEAPDISIADDVPRDEPTLEGVAFSPPSEPSDYGVKGFSLQIIPSAPPEFPLEASLANIQRVTAPNDTPNAFFTSANGFLFVFLGDIDTQASNPWLSGNNWNTEYDGQGFHVLALPFQFTLPEDPQ